MRLFYFLLRMLRVKQIWYIFLAISILVAFSKLIFLRNRTILTRNFVNESHKLKNVQFVKSNMFNHSPLFVAPVKPSTKFIPGQFLVGVLPKAHSYCNFKYGSDTFDWTRNVSFSPELGASGPYRVIYNIVENNYKSNNVSFFGLTYCTHATPEFLYHIVEIVRRWDSYVSIAVFVPGNDAFLSLIIIRQICRCFPEMSKISLHFIFPAQHPPEFHENTSDGTTSLNNTLFKDCSAPKAILSKDFETYKSKKDLFYPINVARNVARVGARTSFILVSDVELLPSQNLVSEFFSMIGRFQKRQNIFHPLISEETSLKKYVFVLPVFEVDSEETDVPQTKSDLLSLYGKSKAVYFHRWVCLHCQRFPGLQRWLQKTPPGAPNIRPLLVVRREFPYHRWEPIYIGTNQEPMYSELLSWEGQQDKMTQMNEMCLLGYRFVILDGAFLVHTPGMKRKSHLSNNQTMWQKPHQQRNIKIYESITQEMIQKYKGNKRCRVR